MRTLRFSKIDAGLWFKPRYDSMIWVLFVSTQTILLGSQIGDTGLALPLSQSPLSRSNQECNYISLTFFISHSCPHSNLLLLFLVCFSSLSQSSPLVGTNHSLYTPPYSLYPTIQPSSRSSKYSLGSF